MVDEGKTEAQQVEEALQKQAALIDLAHDAIIVRDLDSRVVSWSRGAEATYGFTAEHALGQVTHELLRPQFPTTLEDVDQSLTQHGQWSGELVHTRADGEAIVVSSRQALQHNDRGEPVAILEINRDITEQKQAEQELAKLNTELEQRVKERTEELQEAVAQLEEEITERKRAEQQVEAQRQLLEVVVQHIPAPLALYRGPDHAFELANPAHLAIAPGKTMLGRPLKDVWPEIYSHLGPLFDRVLETGEPFHTVDDKVQIRRSPDGPLETAYFSWSLVRVRLPGEGGWGILNTAVETTERKRAEEALRESEKRLNFALETSRTGAWELNLLDHTAHRSPEHDSIFGYAQVLPEWNYEMFLEHVVPEDRAMVDGKYRHAVETQSDWSFECRIRRADGEMRWIWAIGRHLFDAAGIIYKMSGIVQDITERKRAEEVLERQYAILSGINRVFKESLTCETEEQLGETYLRVAEELTGSKFGFIDELDKNGKLNSIAISYLGWEACKIPGTEELVLPKNLHVQGIYSVCLTEGRSEIANDPASHPDRVGTPPGHPPITSFLGVPLIQNGKAIGMIGLGNKEWGYTDADREVVEALASAIVETFMRQRAEEALKDSEERFRTMANAMPQLAWIAERDGYIFWYNQRWYEYTGTTPEEMKGWGWQSVHDPEMLPQVLEQWKASLATGKPFEMVFPLRGADGQFREFLTRGFPLKDADGQVIQWFGTNTDITERQRAEEVLRESEERFRLLVDGVKDYAIFMLDPAGRVLSWNAGAQRLKGWTAEEIIGQHFSRFYPAESVADGHPQQLLERAAAQGHYEDEGWRVHKDGSRFFAEVTTTALRDEQGRLRGFANVIRDITERKRQEVERQSLLAEQQALAEELATTNEELQVQAEELIVQQEELKRLNADLKTANQEMESFSYSVSHDLKAPVRAIEGFSRMLMGEHADKLDEEALRLLKVITTNTKLMHHLIDDLLALSRLGRLQIKKSVVNLTSMARQIFEQLRSEAPKRGLRLTLGYLPMSLGDQSLLYQVLQNLLANAIKFTKSRKTAVIKVGGRSEGKENIYFVKDNGAGFDDRYVDSLFRPFQRLHGGEEFEGTGIGLALVKRIIQRHGGRVWAEGKVGEGATFYFALPKE